MVGDAFVQHVGHIRNPHQITRIIMTTRIRTV